MKTFRPQPSPALRLRIGTLSLPAGSPAHGERVAAAFQAELGRLLGAASSLQRLRESPLEAAVLDAGTLRVGRYDRPEQIGRRLARSLAQSLLDPVVPAHHRRPRQ